MKKEKFLLIYLCMVIGVIGICVAVVIAFYITHKNDDRIQSGIYIKNINVSGLTKDEATKLLEEKLNLELNDHLTLKYENYEYYVEVEQIDAEFDIAASVDLAYSVGRSGNIITDLKDYVTVLLAQINIDPVLSYNKQALDEYVEYLEAMLPDQLEQSSYYYDDEKVVITNGTFGARIYVEDLEKEIIENIKDITYKNRIINIPTYAEYPDKIDVQAIHDEVYREMQNAYYTTTEPRMVYAEVVGVDFNVEQVEKAIEDNPNVSEYIVELAITNPEVTVDDFGMDAFPDLLGSFSTKYVNNADRTTNLKLASDKINGKVVMPGESFSFNKIVGKRTTAAGYKNAAIFSNGEVTDGLGGGICQVTTTLYNAVTYADLEVTSRRNHMFVPSYVNGGRDATVVYGSTDFVFTNNRTYPIKIKSSVSGGVCQVEIYGYKNPNEENYDISIESNLVKSTSTTLVYDMYKIYKQNGQEVKRVRMHRDTYKKY